MAGEGQAAGRLWVAVVALVEQAVDVVGQAGGGGAHGVVPQDVDHVVQSVQTILHLRLRKAKAEWECWTGNTGHLLRGAQLNWLSFLARCGDFLCPAVT